MTAVEDNRFELIKKGEIKAFESLFKSSYKPLTAFAFRYTSDLSVSESIVQDVLYKLWQKREELSIRSSLDHYLFRAVRNRCLNYIESEKIRTGYRKMVIDRENSRTDFDEFYPEVDLLSKIEKAIDGLPEKRREIFRLTREEGLKYREIAERMNLSVKTVEAQMTLALKQLRDALKDYRTFLLFFIFHDRVNSR